MLKVEKTIIEWINKYIIQIALVFVFFVGILIRITGCNYIGIDYHFSLYDIPGNCHSYLFRHAVNFLMAAYPDFIINIIKFLAYIGDYGVTLLTVLLFKQKRQNITLFQGFLAVTACVLSPVSLLYSVTGMRIDSICMCLILLSLLLHNKGWFITSIPISALAAFLLPSFWPIVIIMNIIWILSMAQTEKKDQKHSFSYIKTISGTLSFLVLLIFSVYLENLESSSGYYWGKIFVMNPSIEASYSNLLSWLSGMLHIYGYSLAMFSLVFSFIYKKLRIPALIIHLLILISIGWYQTAHFAL